MPKRRLVIFLSGGMHSGWQDTFIERYPTIDFLDPRSHGLTDPVEYTRWDLSAVDRCDAVIGYMEADNPSGVGTAMEVGYAIGRGKLVYFCHEKDDRYFDIVRVAATFSFFRIEHLIEMFDDHFLNNIIQFEKWV